MSELCAPDATMAEVFDTLDTLQSRLTPAMLIIPVASLQAALPHNSVGE
jgi:hypothetical protein